MSKKFLKFWPIFFLCLLTFLLRIIRIEQLFYFTYDEEIPAFVGRRLILWHHIPLIGGVTPFGFHLAPYFYWFYATLLFIGKLNPVIWGWAGAAIAVVTSLLMYIVGKELGTKKTGFTASALWTFSYLANLYDRHLWALYWAPLISLVVLLCLHKLIKGRQKFVYLLGTTLALSIHADPSNLIFILMTILIWILYKIPFKKSTLVAIVIILLSFLPLVAFDLRHNFANTKPVLAFAKTGNNNPGFSVKSFMNNSLLLPRTFTRVAYTFGDNQVSKQYSYCKNFIEEKFEQVPTYLTLISLIVLLFFTITNFRNHKKPMAGFVSILVLFYFFGIQIYGTIFKADIFEHYITGLLSAFLLILSYYISKLPKKIWILAIVLFVIFNMHKVLDAKNDLGLAAKRQAIEYTMQEVGDKPFSLDSLSTCWKLSGYRYLFTVFGREPVKSYVDPNFSYLYGTTPVWDQHPTIVVTFVTHDFAPETDDFYKRYALLKSHELKSALFGRIEVIIMDNTSSWFDQAQERIRPNIPLGID